MPSAASAHGRTDGRTDGPRTFLGRRPMQLRSSLIPPDKMSAALAPLAGPSRTTCRSLSSIAASSISRLPSAPLRRPRHLHTFPPLASHENPLGLPRNTDRLPPKMPQRSRGGPPAKRPVPNVKHVLAVSSCKGGVGKSTVAGESRRHPITKSRC